MAVRAITAIRAFYLKGQVVGIGETVSVKESVASELISSYKAVPAVEQVKPADELRVPKPPPSADISNENDMEVPAGVPAEPLTENKSRGRYRNVK